MSRNRKSMRSSMMLLAGSVAVAFASVGVVTSVQTSAQNQRVERRVINEERLPAFGKVGDLGAKDGLGDVLLGAERF